MGGSISGCENREGIFGIKNGREILVVEGEGRVSWAKRESAGGGRITRGDLSGECGRGFHRRGQVTGIDRRVPINSVSSGRIPALTSERRQASRFIVRDYEAVLASMNDTGRINAGDVQNTDNIGAIFSALLLCKDRENTTTAWRTDVRVEQGRQQYTYSSPCVNEYRCIQTLARRLSIRQ